MQYVILRDDETGEVEIVGRFLKYGVGEIWLDGKWQSDPTLYSNLFDGLLENITEAEAKKIIAEITVPQLQAA